MNDVVIFMEELMKAAVLHAPNNLAVEDVQIPDIGSGDVLLKTSYCGICGSDIPRVLVTGTYHFPTIPGHEFGGVVVKTGSDVPKNLVGKKAAVKPLIPCHECEMCEIGNFAQCRAYDFLGSRSDGGFAQFVKVPADNLVILPDEADEKMTAFLEPVTVAQHVVRNAGLKYGSTAAVFGLGAIGMFIAQWAKAFGASRVFAIDVDEKKVELAKKLGLADAICASRDDVKKIIAEKTGGVDFAFEASGAGIAFKQSVEILRQSGVLALVGRPTKNITFEPQIFEKILRAQLTIKGTWSFEMKKFPHDAWKESADSILSGKILIEPLISHILPLSDINKGIDIMANHREFFTKILISPNN